VNAPSPAALPIGVFDSGVGGLTVLRALQLALPGEQFIYLGDTARLPYGTKSPETVIRYSVQAAELLVKRGIKALVVACNTASAAALPELQRRFSSLPVIGVVEPGARAAAAASVGGRIVVLATEGTVRGGAYQRAIHAVRPEARVTSVACQLFVALAEEGWIDGGVVADAIARYLNPVWDALGPGNEPDTLVLGCTHFPVLRGAIARHVGPGVTLVDSAATTAAATRELLAARGLLRESGSVAGAGSGPARGTATTHYLATDSSARFAGVGRHFLGRELSPQSVEVVDL
jgi:glutamate racemase